MPFRPFYWGQQDVSFCGEAGGCGVTQSQTENLCLLSSMGEATHHVLLSVVLCCVVPRGAVTAAEYEYALCYNHNFFGCLCNSIGSDNLQRDGISSGGVLRTCRDLIRFSTHKVRVCVLQHTSYNTPHRQT